MTISKRTITTHSSDINGRIQVKEFNQIIDTTQDEEGNEYIEVLKSIPHSGVIDPSQGDYDAKVKALGKKLVGSLAASQESLIRTTELRCEVAEDLCAKHCETIKKDAKTIARLEKIIAEKDLTITRLNKAASK